MQLPLAGDNYARELLHLKNLRAKAQEIPNMTVVVTEGSCYIGDSLVEYDGGSSPIFVAPVSLARIDALCLNISGQLVITQGIAASTPQFPDVPPDRLPIAFILLQAGQTMITNSGIFDNRPVFYWGIHEHNKLFNRDAEGQHPIGAITHLQMTLDAKADRTDLTNVAYLADLEVKADMLGNNNTTFTLNRTHAGVPIQNCAFSINRGSAPAVSLRFNENTQRWEFTNDGVTYFPFLTSAFAEKATTTQLGSVLLSTDAVDPNFPIVVGDNDTRILTPSEKSTLIGHLTTTVDAHGANPEITGTLTVQRLNCANYDLEAADLPVHDHTGVNQGGAFPWANITGFGVLADIQACGTTSSAGILTTVARADHAHSVDHTQISNIGTNTHADIDTAISNSATHISDVNNPHAVTANQIGADNIVAELNTNATTTIDASHLDPALATTGYVDGLFNITTGHDHNGTNSKTIDLSLQNNAVSAFVTSGDVSSAISTHAGNADAHHSSTSNGIAITPLSVVTGDVTTTGDIIINGNPSTKTFHVNIPEYHSQDIEMDTNKTVDGRDLSADGATLDNHILNVSNPHSVTANQIGGNNIITEINTNGTGTINDARIASTIARDSEVAAYFNITTGHDHDGINSKKVDHNNLNNIGTNSHADIDTHISSTSNPHSVTASQTGAVAVGDTIYMPLNKMIVWGDGVTDGSWREYIDGVGNKVTEKLELGIWVVKQTLV